MPQMEKFGNASAATTVTSAPGSSSRARSAALIPASLPPIMTRRMGGSPFAWWLPGWWERDRCPVASRSAVLLGWVLVVGDDDVGGVGRGQPRVQRPDHQNRQGAAEGLGGD